MFLTGKCTIFGVDLINYAVVLILKLLNYWWRYSFWLGGRAGGKFFSPTISSPWFNNVQSQMKANPVATAKSRKIQWFWEKTLEHKSPANCKAKSFLHCNPPPELPDCRCSLHTGWLLHVLYLALYLLISFIKFPFIFFFIQLIVFFCFFVIY